MIQTLSTTGGLEYNPKWYQDETKWIQFVIQFIININENANLNIMHTYLEKKQQNLHYTIIWEGHN